MLMPEDAEPMPRPAVPRSSVVSITSTRLGNPNGDPDFIRRLCPRYNRYVDIYGEIVRLRKQGQKCALATIVEVNGSIPSYESAKMLVREDGSMMGTVGGGCVEAEVWTAAREVIATDKPKHLTFSLGQDAAYDNGLICGGQLNIFIEPVAPQPQAIIFGGGHVSKSISKVANIAGFSTIVVDDREAFANAERFPEAEATYAEEYESVFPKLPVNTSSYLIIVTRGHRDDMRVLRWAVGTPARYIAMIGSKRKTISVVKELEKEGLPRQAFEKIFAPMGLEIGAESPEEIAVSVVAEMIAVRRSPNVNWKAVSKSVFAHESLRALLK
jgi:xanthine dehydrogenase accessory factor